MATLFADCAPSRIGILFAEDFDAPPGIVVLEDADEEVEVLAHAPLEPTPPPPDIEAVREAAYAEGLRNGLAQAAADRAEITRQMLSTIADRMVDAGREAAAVADGAAEEIARLVLTTLGRMLPATCARHGAAEVAALAGAVLPALAHEPRVTIRVSPHVMAGLQEALGRLDPDLQPRIAVVPTDAMAPGDARITWQDGSASRDTGALWRDIAAALAPLGLIDQTADQFALTPAH